MAMIESQISAEVWRMSGQLNAEEPVRDIYIRSSPFTVGRRPECDLAASNPRISALHAELVPSSASLLVRDLGSTNGTFVNGVRITGATHIGAGDLLQFADTVFRVAKQSSRHDGHTLRDDASDRALALIQFEKLMADQAVAPHYQAILDLATSGLAGYEVLGRSRLFGLQTAGAMFSAAAALGREADLSRVLRSAGVRDAAKLVDPKRIFLNTHPREVDDLPVLMLSLRELREFAGQRRLTLELHEGVVTCVRQMRELRALLSDLSIELAYDDFGSGQGRLVELVEVPPDYLKFDMALIRQIDVASHERQRMLASLVRMAKDLGIVTVAEGVETTGEDATCREIGFDCAQGYLYGKPMIPERCEYLPSADPAGCSEG